MAADSTRPGVHGAPSSSGIGDASIVVSVGAGTGVHDDQPSILTDREGEAPVRKEHGRGDRSVDAHRVERQRSGWRGR